MAICDLCSTPIGPEAKRYSASQLKTAVRAGLRPPTTAFELGAAFGMSQAQAEESWVQRVMADTTDWLFCLSCASRVEQYLSQSQAKRESSQINRVIKEATTTSPVLDSEPSPASLVMLGQVDHGKTTLTSAITKTLSSKGLADYVPVNRIEKNAEERSRGSSTAMAHIEFKTQKRHYGIVDFPRHADIIRGLTTGAVQPGGAILVVAVTDEPPMPQTREQLLVAQRVEMPYIVVFLNKVDLVDDEDLLELAELELQLLLDECGFPGDDIPIVRGSALKALESDGIGPDAASIMELLDAVDAASSGARPTSDIILREVEVKRGGLGEPYCSEECYARAAQYPLLQIAPGVRCGICGNIVQSSLHYGRNYAVVPYEGGTLVVCQNCGHRAREHFQSYRKCCMCQKSI
jgi:signal recognition particle receptor subunit beta